MKNIYLIGCLTLVALALSCKTEVSKEKVVDPLEQQYDSTLWPFYHGVASGDPLPDRIILWTRVTPDDNDSSVNVSWEIAEDLSFSSIYKSDLIDQ